MPYYLIPLLGQQSDAGHLSCQGWTSHVLRPDIQDLIDVMKAHQSKRGIGNALMKWTNKQAWSSSSEITWGWLLRVPRVCADQETYCPSHMSLWCLWNLGFTSEPVAWQGHASYPAEVRRDSHGMHVDSEIEHEMMLPHEIFGKLIANPRLRHLLLGREGATWLKFEQVCYRSLLSILWTSDCARYP